MANMLILLGAEVKGYSLPPKPSPNLFDLIKLDQKIDSTFADIRDYETLAREMKDFGPDIVIHMAAQALVLTSYQSPRETYSTNVLGTVHLLESVRYCPQIGVVINITTDKCYDNAEKTTGYTESDTLGGVDPYSSSKACSEFVTRAYLNSFFLDSTVKIATARAGNVIGGGDWNDNRLIPDVMRAIINNGRLVIRNPEAVRPWQHVLDVIWGYMLLIQHLWTKPLGFDNSFGNIAWNFGPEPETTESVRSVVNHILSLWGLDASFWQMDTQKHSHESKLLYLNANKAKTILGWKNTLSLADALSLTVDWYKAYKNNQDIVRVLEKQIERFFLALS